MQSLAYADDIVIVTKGIRKVVKALDILQDWTQEYKVDLNKKKSAIMAVRKDHHTPAPGYINLHGIPLVTEYRYLGVLADEKGTFHA